MDALVISGIVDRQRIPRVCDRVRSVLESCDEDVVWCDVGAIDHPDAAVVDMLARVQLLSKRLGRRVRFVEASPELRDLVALMGLASVLAVEPCWQTEEREEMLGIEEETDA